MGVTAWTLQVAASDVPSPSGKARGCLVEETPMTTPSAMPRDETTLRSPGNTLLEQPRCPEKQLCEVTPAVASAGSPGTVTMTLVPSHR